MTTFSHKSTLTAKALNNHITRRKIDKKSQYLNELKKECTLSWIGIVNHATKGQLFLKRKKPIPKNERSSLS